jgi:hypothetical protein
MFCRLQPRNQNIQIVAFSREDSILISRDVIFNENVTPLEDFEKLLSTQNILHRIITSRFPSSYLTEFVRLINCMSQMTCCRLTDFSKDFHKSS